MSIKVHDQDVLADLPESDLASQIRREHCWEIPFLLKVCVVPEGSSIKVPVSIFLFGLREIAWFILDAKRPEVCLVGHLPVPEFLSLIKWKFCVKVDFPRRRVRIYGHVCAREPLNPWKCIEFDEEIPIL